MYKFRKDKCYIESDVLKASRVRLYFIIHSSVFLRETFNILY